MNKPHYSINLCNHLSLDQSYLKVTISLMLCLSNNIVVINH